MLAARLAHGSYAISSLTKASEKWSNKAFVRTALEPHALSRTEKKLTQRNRSQSLFLRVNKLSKRPDPSLTMNLDPSEGSRWEE
jgi:hypothetical protein